MAQESQSPAGELFLKTRSVPNGVTVYFNIHSYSSTLWKAYKTTNEYWVILTEDYRDVNTSIYGNDMLPNHSFDMSDDNPGMPKLGRNIYEIKVTNPGAQAKVTIDANGCDFSGGDLHLVYDYANDQFLKDNLVPIVNYAQYTGKDCLELYLTLTNQSGHPYLSWNPYHSSNILGYNLYKKITTSSGSMTDIIFTTNTYYTDDEFTIDPKNGDDIVEYWVKAKITQSQLSLESNHRSTEGISQIQWKIDNKGEQELDKSELFSNYPNPFNPRTRIRWQSPVDGRQVLKVFDVLGNEIATLVDEYREAGRYEVEFSAKDGLANGIYFYRLQVYPANSGAGSFVETKKMLMVK